MTCYGIIRGAKSEIRRLEAKVGDSREVTLRGSDQFSGSEKGRWLEVKMDQNSVRADFAVLTRPKRPLSHELSKR